MNTKVILCANSKPSLNDITYKEMADVVAEAGKTCDLIKTSYNNKQLLLGENGNYGCCLNFMEINE